MSVSTFKTFFVKRRNCFFKQFSYMIDDDFTLEVEEDPEDAEEDTLPELKIDTDASNDSSQSKTELTNNPPLERLACDNSELAQPNKMEVTDSEESVSKEKSVKRYECTYCSYNTSRKVYYMSHMDAHLRPNESIPCPNCPFRAFCMSALTAHQARCEATTNKIYCPHCKFTTLKVKLMNRHLKRVHPTNPLYSCPLCPFKTMKWSLADKHKELHEKKDSARFKCYCGFEAVEKQILTDHRRLVHKDESKKKYQCGLCDFQSVYTDKVKKHHLEKHVKNRKSVESENIVSSK